MISPLHSLTELATGFLLGGLGLSSAWGWLWFSVGLIGFVRGSCSVRVLLNSLTVGVVPLALVGVLVWARGGPGPMTLPLSLGLAGMPVVLLTLAARSAPDGRRAGIHLWQGVRHLVGDLLGRHPHCGGCEHHGGHEPEGCR